jgi:hypothetical protein
MLLPFTMWLNGELRVCNDASEFIAWWQPYVGSIRAEKGFVRGEILRLDIEPLSATAALARMLSSRLDVANKVISTPKTAFIVYHAAGNWKVAGFVSDIIIADLEQ